jgi:Zn-dependent protease
LIASPGSHRSLAALIAPSPKSVPENPILVLYSKSELRETTALVAIDFTNPDTLVLGVTWYVVFLFSTTCHEAAHALAAKLGGDLTAFHGGQVSLDPIPHIRREPFGMVLFPILTYVVSGWMMGWASAPFDPLWAQRHPRRAAWMSLAGPGANLSLTVLAGLAIHAGLAMRVFGHPDSANFTHIVLGLGSGTAEGTATFLSVMFSLNLLLGVFNLLPVPPLDGFGAIGLLLSEKAGQKFQEMGLKMRGFSMVGLLIAWRIFDPIFDPIFTLALRLLYPGYGYGS